jgi:hypothetical protein
LILPKISTVSVDFNPSKKYIINLLECRVGINLPRNSPAKKKCSLKNYNLFLLMFAMYI